MKADTAIFMSLDVHRFDGTQLASDRSNGDILHTDNIIKIQPTGSRLSLGHGRTSSHTSQIRSLVVMVVLEIVLETEHSNGPEGTP